MSNKKAPGGRGQETREIEVDAAKYAAFPGRVQGGLDACRRFRHAGGPKTTRGVASAFPASQEPEQVLPYISLLLSKLLPCIRMAGCLRILAGCNVRMSVRLRRLRVGRGALYPAFFIIPNYTRPL